MTRLRINNAKSCFVPIAIPEELVLVVEGILGCSSSNLPITYLGLPLTAKKPNIIDFLPLITAVEARVASWKSALLSFGGKLTLIKAVLLALPLHYMQALLIPKWVIRQINRIRRNFLWKGNEMCKLINCLVNWEKTCALKQSGGLELIDLHTQNKALLTKWIWIMHAKRDSNRTGALRVLYDVDRVQQIGKQVTQFFFPKRAGQPYTILYGIYHGASIELRGDMEMGDERSILNIIRI